MPGYKLGQTADSRDEEAEAGTQPDGSDEAVLIGQLQRALQGAPDLPARSDGDAGADSRRAYDYPGAIDLVRGAADFMRVMEERARESETRIQDILKRTAQELKAAEARAEAADQRTRAAEARAEDAERRARETQEWLDRILSVISDELKR